MSNAEQILSRLISEKDEREALSISLEEFCETVGQRVVVRPNEGNGIWNYHTHKFYEINYVLKGSCINLIEEEPVFMKEGELILMNPGTYHIFCCPENDVLLNFLIDEEWFLNHLKPYRKENCYIDKFVKNTKYENFYRYLFVSPKNDEVRDLVKKILNIIESEEKKKYLMLESAVLEFFCLLIFGNNDIRLSEISGNNSETARWLIKYMHDNYQTVTLDDVAKYAGYSKNHICRIFKEKIGKSFSSVLSDIRIGRAKYSLINTEDSVKSIAALVGYESVEYFQRLFKRTVGMTPGEYRKNYCPLN